jgi:hypothetical protein
MIVDTSIFEVKYKGTVKMNSGFIKTYDMDVEYQGIVDLEGRGYPGGQGPGAGTGYNGGSHGGYGGSATVASGAAPYGFTYRPTLKGSGGGNVGGAGGGFLEVDVGFLLHVDGTITVEGIVLQLHIFKINS